MKVNVDDLVMVAFNWGPAIPILCLREPPIDFDSIGGISGMDTLAFLAKNFGNQAPTYRAFDPLTMDVVKGLSPNSLNISAPKGLLEERPLFKMPCHSGAPKDSRSWYLIELPPWHVWCLAQWLGEESEYYRTQFLVWALNEPADLLVHIPYRTAEKRVVCVADFKARLQD